MHAREENAMAGSAVSRRSDDEQRGPRHDDVSERPVATQLGVCESLTDTRRELDRRLDLEAWGYDVRSGEVERPRMILVHGRLGAEHVRYLESCAVAGAEVIVDLSVGALELRSRTSAAVLERILASASLVTTDSLERAKELAEVLEIDCVGIVPDTIRPLPSQPLPFSDSDGDPKLVWLGTAGEIAGLEPVLRALDGRVELRALVLRDSSRVDLRELRERHRHVAFESIELDDLGVTLARAQVALVTLAPGDPHGSLPLWKLGTCALSGVPCLLQGEPAAQGLARGVPRFASEPELWNRLEELSDRKLRRDIVEATRRGLCARLEPGRVRRIFRKALSASTWDGPRAPETDSSGPDRLPVGANGASGRAGPSPAPRPDPGPSSVAHESRILRPTRAFTRPSARAQPVPFSAPRAAPHVAPVRAECLGDERRRLEALLAERVGATHAVAVQSAQAAQLLALLAVGIRPGDEVILSALAPRSIPAAVLQAGARPVLADVDDATLVPGPEQVEPLIRASTRALIASGYAGCPAPLDALVRLADRRGLVLLEFAPEGPGGRRADGRVGGRPSSALGLDSGHGDCSSSLGFVTASDSRMRDELCRLRDEVAPSRLPDPPRAPDPLFVAFGLRRLARLRGRALAHRADGRILSRALAGGVREAASLLLPFDPEAWSAPWRFHVRSQCRDALREHLSRWMIPTGPPEPLLHACDFLRDAIRSDLSVSQRVHAELLTLPEFESLTPIQRAQVEDALRAFQERFPAR